MLSDGFTLKDTVRADQFGMEKARERLEKDQDRRLIGSEMNEVGLVATIWFSAATVAQTVGCYVQQLEDPLCSTWALVVKTDEP